MKSFIKKFFNPLTRFTAFIVSLITVCSLIAGYLGLLYIQLTLPIWLLLTIMVTPHVLYIIIRWFWVSQKRLYTLGDAVSVIADDRKFIVMRYNFYRPLYALCKELNTCTLISMHQKFLKPYQEPKQEDPLEILNQNIIKNVLSSRKTKKP